MFYFSEHEESQHQFKKKSYVLYWKAQKAHCVFLQETDSCGSDATFWTGRYCQSNKSAGFR